MTRNTARRSRFLTPTCRFRKARRVNAREIAGSFDTFLRNNPPPPVKPEPKKLVVVDREGNFLPNETAQFHATLIPEISPAMITEGAIRELTEETSAPTLETLCDKIRAKKVEAARKRAEAKANGQTAPRKIAPTKIAAVRSTPNRGRKAA